ncbi:hypothetical protein chiPu_0016340 [Chiloscyllium punctatum]|uniref:Uncharacterized protein n=1 Tax=Chiloscyllium punctatum TaxID=137246 RepID=A0A401T580_CHIPU|nr:hypothetical protein [Chiloscyllium punctatum]
MGDKKARGLLRPARDPGSFKIPRPQWGGACWMSIAATAVAAIWASGRIRLGTESSSAVSASYLRRYFQTGRKSPEPFPPPPGFSAPPRVRVRDLSLGSAGGACAGGR